MRRVVSALALAFCVSSLPAMSADGNAPASAHYMFAWTGDAALKGNDFLAVIDADPSSPSYGHLAGHVGERGRDLRMQRISHVENEGASGIVIIGKQHPAGGHGVFRVVHPSGLLVRGQSGH